MGSQRTKVIPFPLPSCLHRGWDPGGFSGEDISYTHVPASDTWNSLSWALYPSLDTWFGPVVVGINYRDFYHINLLSGMFLTAWKPLFLPKHVSAIKYIRYPASGSGFYFQFLKSISNIKS